MLGPLNIISLYFDVLHSLALVLGIPIGTSSQTLGKKVMTFARICVEIDLSRPLPDAIEMCVGSYSWVQQLDYATIGLCPRNKPQESL